MIGFFHRQLEEVVAARYLGRDNKHAQLAKYFASAPMPRKVDEYPYQLLHAEDWSGLAAVLSDLDFVVYRLDIHGGAIELIQYWRALEGKFDPSQSYQAAVETRIAKTGESEQVATILRRLAQLLGNMAEYLTAIAFYKRGLEIYERILGPDHRLVGGMFHNLALLYDKQGRFRESRNCLLRALEIKERAGIEDEELAATLNNLGMRNLQLGVYNLALPQLERALAIDERTMGKDSPILVEIMGNLGSLFMRQRMYSQALPYLERGLSNLEQAYGPDCVDSQAILTLLGDWYREQGVITQAVSYYQRAIRVVEKMYGPDHPEIKTPLNNLAYLYEGQEKYPEALFT